MNAPIFIVGAHKSGTSLMRSLLDGHPDLFVFPFELHFFECRGFGVSNEYRRQPARSISQQELQDRFNNHIQQIAATQDTMGGTPPELLLDSDIFKQHFSDAHIKWTDQELMETYFTAVAEALGMAFSSEQRWVEKSVEQAEFTADLQRMFPDARFVHMIRNPYANVVALREYRRKRHAYPLLHRVMRTLEQQFQWAAFNQRNLQHYNCVRYEDLVTSPEETMSHLADQLNISFQDSLLQPTVMGNPWGGNSSAEQPLQGISASRLHAWKEKLHPTEHYYINRILGTYYEQWSYELNHFASGFWKRAISESPSRYIANRLYRFYLTEYPRVNSIMRGEL